MLRLVEIFPSFQGEGLLVGVPQVFLRLAGCNLECSYCDTPEARAEPESCRVWSWEGDMESVANPLPDAEVLRRIEASWGPMMHSVSLTGGEPLLQAEALAGVLPRFKERGMSIYLETNGTLPGELRKVLEWVDWIAMDLKLPSALGGRDLLEAQLEFLRVAVARRVFLKLVAEERTPLEEVTGFCRRITREIPGAGEIPFVLQPVSVRLSPFEGPEKEVATGVPRMPGGASPAPGISPPASAGHGWRVGLTARRAAELAEAVAAHFREVRVIPQLHRAWGIK